MLSDNLPSNALHPMYTSFVKSQLECSGGIGHNPAKTNDLFYSTYSSTWVKDLSRHKTLLP